MAYHKTWNTETQNTGETPEHWRNNGILVEQSEYHGIVEHVESSGTTQQQSNTRNTTNTERRHIEQIA